MKVKYDVGDAGCYVDGARGIYATDAIVTFAREQGATIVHDDTDCTHEETAFESEFGGCEFADEYEDQATAFMDDGYSVEEHYWGRNENGDWGLWPADHTMTTAARRRSRRKVTGKIRPSVKAGIEFIRKTFGLEQLRRIDTNKLDLSSCEFCALAQASGRWFSHARAEHDLSRSDTIKLGFSLPWWRIAEPGSAWKELTDEWKQALQSLREEEN